MKHFIMMIVALMCAVNTFANRSINTKMSFCNDNGEYFSIYQDAHKRFFWVDKGKWVYFDKYTNDLLTQMYAKA